MLLVKVLLYFMSQRGYVIGLSVTLLHVTEGVCYWLKCYFTS